MTTKDTAKANHATSKSPPDTALSAEVTARKTEEANADDGKPAKKLKPSEDPVYQAAYQQGRRAYASSIAKADAPHGEGRELDAWTKGYEDAEKQNG